MEYLTISDTSGRAHKLGFPTMLSEVSLSQKVAFDVAMDNITKWVKSSEPSSYYLYLLSIAISEFTRWDLSTILSFDAVGLITDNGDLRPGVLENHFNQYLDDAEVEAESIDNILTLLYSKIIDLIKTYKFEFADKDYSFEYRGRIWKIPTSAGMMMITGRNKYDEVSVKQVIEILTIKKTLRATLPGLDTDKIKNIRYSSLLNVIAVIVEEVGVDKTEYLIDEKKFKAVVDERMVFFKDIPFDLAYDIAFFLTTIMLNYRTIPS